MNRWHDDAAAGDDPYAGRANPRPPERRWPVWLIAAAIAGAGGGGAALLLTSFDGHGPATQGEPPLIRAAEGPTKIPPERPGGLEVPYQDKVVFQQLEPGSGATPAVERLLPGPEVPLPRPVTIPEVPALPSIPEDLPDLNAPAAAPPPTMPANEFAYVPAINTAPTGQQGAPRPYASANQSRPSNVQTSRPSDPPDSSTPRRQTQVAAAPAPTPPADPPRDQAQTEPAGGWGIQLASVRSEEAANKEWNRLRNRYRDLLGGLGLTVIRADLGQRGIFYRVIAGKVPEDRARAVCSGLKERRVDCFVVSP